MYDWNSQVSGSVFVESALVSCGSGAAWIISSLVHHPQVFATNFAMYNAIDGTITCFAAARPRTHSAVLLSTAAAFLLAGVAGITIVQKRLAATESDLDPEAVKCAQDSIRHCCAGFSFVIGKLWWKGWSLLITSEEDVISGKAAGIDSKQYWLAKWKQLAAYVYLAAVFSLLAVFSSIASASLRKPSSASSSSQEERGLSSLKALSKRHQEEGGAKKLVV